MSDIVKPRALSGFPEWLPEQKIVEERMLRFIRGAFERFGFAPIETLAVERKEVLTAKGVAHTFELAPGRHDFVYWKARLPRSLAFFAASLAKE